ncbi:NADPH-dependent F420 reductase [Cohnella cholangitidis]|uniref:Reductase n=1 Tax=Cohnella cholangitidis TaxID=2598458 RepID=A0A7G5BYF6_9BACL|nr:NAD(P)-binding domain-containing protein [Cohnella cholangitidis]QMV41990.1 reductase [Cohnella cholangitidis]
MRVSVIGTGRMGRGLIGMLASALNNAELTWASRSPDKTRELLREAKLDSVVPVGMNEALQADVIFAALWFRDLLPWAEDLKEELRGKILVDIANPFTEDFKDFTTEWGTSAAEQLQNRIPGTKVVGAFKNTFFKVLENPVHDGQWSDVYVTSDDVAAKAAVLQLLGGIPFRVLDGGALGNNRIIERMTLFERELAIRYGTYPYASFRLFGLNGGRGG